MRRWVTERRRALGALALGAVLLLSGCGALYDGAYYVSAPYEPPAGSQEEGEAAYDDITSYPALRRALNQLVAGRVESAQLQFTGYDGDLSQDISTACWEAKSSSALGAFAVDYISYDLSRIVSYYQAEVNITYKRSAAQMEALEYIPTLSALSQRLTQALENNETYLALRLSAASLTADGLLARLETAYFDDPLSCPVLPEAEVGLYPETGVDRIAEISLNYGLEPEELSQRRADMTAAAQDAAGRFTPGPDADAAAWANALAGLCGHLADACRVEAGAGSSAWDALVGGAADSRGMALAVKAAAQAMGLDCRVVSGRIDSGEHYWNMAELDGAWYHLDASRTQNGSPAVFLAGDEQLWGVYWWDTSQYPACPAAFGAQDVPVPAPAENA